MSEDARSGSGGCLPEIIKGAVITVVVLAVSLLSGETHLGDLAIPGWIRSHWSSLTMLLMACVCTWSLFGFLQRRQSLSTRLGVPEWAVTVWEQQARERENSTLALLVAALFAAAFVILVLELVLSGWGGFSVVRWVAVGLHALVSLILSLAFWRGP
jgi:hypothetical protein